MAERRQSNHRTKRHVLPAYSDHSMVSENDLDEDLTLHLTQKPISGYNEHHITSSPSYTILEGKTDLLLDDEAARASLDRPMTVAISHNVLPNVLYAHDAMSWEIPNSQHLSTSKESLHKPIELGPIGRKKNSQRIINHLRNDGFIMGKSGMSYTLHFNDDEKEKECRVKQFSTSKPLPPVGTCVTNHREAVRRQREYLGNRAQAIVERAGFIKRDKVLERIRSAHRTSSSTERNKEEKMEKTIKLEDKRRRKAAVEARKQDTLPENENTTRPNGNQGHVSRKDGAMALRNNGARIKGSAKKREGKSKKN